jgi:zinc transport system substrate-binding protein
LVVLGACGSGTGASSRGGVSVVASFYPLAFVAQRVGGADVRVRNLTPAGVEPHDLELSPTDVDRIESADVVIVLGRDFQPAVERATRRNQGTLRVLDTIAVGGTDPHAWLDPVAMKEIVAVIAKTLEAADPAHASVFTQRAADLQAELSALDGRYRAGLAACQRREIVTAHEAFGQLAARYGLTQRAIAGLSPEAEPSPAKLAELADLVRREGITTVFTEQLVSRRVADALARESGANTAVLNPIEGLTKDELEHGDTYLTVMDGNLAKLRQALGCTAGAPIADR